MKVSASGDLCCQKKFFQFVFSGEKGIMRALPHPDGVGWSGISAAQQGHIQQFRLCVRRMRLPSASWQCGQKGP